MSIKVRNSKPIDKSVKPVVSASIDAKGVVGMGINSGSNRLPYPMVLLLKKFLVTLKKGEHVVESQRQRLASLAEFEPHAAF